MSVRFNDLFATVLSAQSESDWSRATLWRQCVDLLAQYDRGEGTEAAELDQVAETLASVGRRVAEARKLATLRDLGGRLQSPRLVRLLLTEDATVQVAAMTHARLSDRQWPAIVAEAGPLARSVLRRRSDLGPETLRALDAFGLSDLSLIDLNADMRLPAEEPPTATEEGGDDSQSQIRRIVDRIERFTSERQDRVQRDPVPPPTEEAPEPETVVQSFTFLADGDGVIDSAHGVPRSTLIGMRLAAPSLDRNHGPDGQIIGAFRRRGAFRDGRLTIGEGALEGCWLVDGDPLFDQRSGRFKGYRGSARRARDRDLAPQMPLRATRQDEAAVSPASHSTSLRQLIHELRSPLNGVMGFAELIESQLLGSVSDPYRSMAGDIVEDVRSLVEILDDLDLANRTDRLNVPAGPQGSDVARIVRETVERLGHDADGRARIALEQEESLPVANVAPMIAERMIAHFVRAVRGCVGSETLSAYCRLGKGGLVIDIDRPVAMQGLSEAQLFDSGFEHAAINRDAPVLGVGFALRLVRRLAQANKSRFSVHAGHFSLSMPILARPTEQEASS